MTAHTSILTSFMLAASSHIAMLNPPAHATDLSAGGFEILQTNCSECHAVGVNDVSAHREAPAFRTLGQNYEISFLAEALAEGIMTGHADMPVFEFEPDEVDQIIAYLEEIQAE
jgi:mono/diheme cytochrome c family protein